MQHGCTLQQQRFFLQMLFTIIRFTVLPKLVLLIFRILLLSQVVYYCGMQLWGFEKVGLTASQST